MRKLTLLGCLLASCFALAGENPQTFTGTVTDAMCGAKHAMGSPAECTRACVKEGSAYALVIGDKVYTLSGKTDGLDALAGEQATVKGKADGKTIAVESVAAAAK